MKICERSSVVIIIVMNVTHKHVRMNKYGVINVYFILRTVLKFVAFSMYI